MNLENLEFVRELMGEELDFDVERNSVYKSAFMLKENLEKYILLLREEIKQGNAENLSEKVKLLLTIPVDKRGRTRPHDAHITYGEGEFNRFYIRAVCLMAIKENKKIVVYRAKHSMKPRSESEMKIGRELDSERLLKDMKDNFGNSTELGMGLPNSGLSIKLV